MIKTQPLTIPNIVLALKKAGFTTKDDLKTLRKQIDDDQFEARSEFYMKMIKPDFIKLDEKIDKVDTKIDNLSLEVSGIKDDLKGLNVEFSLAPSREEFEKLSRSILTQ
ncbi:MAG: hypothetical protein Q8P91_00635 [bacterium]|nr:hypothetical protein [bacterium]